MFCRGHHAPRVLAGATVLAVVLAGCGGGGGDANGSQRARTAPKRQAGTNPAGTEAARFRAALTGHFHTDASLVAYIVHAAMESGMESERTRAGIEALHHSGKVLVREIRSAHGGFDAKDGTKEVRRFADEWEHRTGALVTYIEGAVRGSDALMTTGEEQLHQYESELALIVQDLTDQIITEHDAEGMLGGHSALTTSAVDAIVEGDSGAPDEILEVGRAGEETAKKLARAFAVATSQELPGNAIDEAATLRADFTGLFVEHVAGVVLLTEVVAASGADSGAVTTTIEALKKDVDDLALQFEQLYGKAAAEEFTGIARKHLEDLRSYAEARASGTKPASAPSDDRSYARDFARFAAQVTGGEVQEREMTTALSQQGRAVEAAIDAVAGGSPSAPEKIEHAESLAERSAALLALGIVEQSPEKFGNPSPRG